MTQVRGGGARKWLIGCGIAAAVFVVLCVVAGYVGLDQMQKYMVRKMDHFKAMGFTQTVRGQDVKVDQPVTSPTIFLAQKVTINADVYTDIVILAQEAVINSRIKGVVYFQGQTLTIGQNAVLDRNLDLQAQTVTISGKVAGKTTGKWLHMTTTGTVAGADLGAPLATAPSVESSGGVAVPPGVAAESTGIAATSAGIIAESTGVSTEPAASVQSTE